MSLNAIGLVADVLGIASFFQSLIPNAPDAQGTHITIKWGLGDQDSSDLGGEVTAVHGFDYNNAYLGKSDSAKQDAGGSAELVIDQTVPNVQADFVSVENGDDASCLAWVTVGNLDSAATSSMWTGDIGYACGQDWYEGNQQCGKLPDGNDWRPKCMWLDGNHDNDIKIAAFKFRSTAYSQDGSQGTLDDSRACSSTIFGPDSGPIAGEPAKRSARQRSARIAGDLVVSKFPGHSATRLCNSPTSFGPDFIDSTGKYCDMGEKKLYSLCSVESIDGCVELAADNSTLTQRRSVAKREVNKVFKTFTKLTEWE